MGEKVALFRPLESVQSCEVCISPTEEYSAASVERLRGYRPRRMVFSSLGMA